MARWFSSFIEQFSYGGLLVPGDQTLMTSHVESSRVHGYATDG